MDTDRAPSRPPWRETVIEAAHQAARHENEVKGRNPEGYLYRWEHVQAVARVAVRLAELTGADAEIVEAAAWLHDVGKLDRENHGRSGALASLRILADTDYPRAKIAAVAEAIAKHVGLTTAAPVEPLEAAVVWDADKLTKLGATAILHFASSQVSHSCATTEELLHRLSAVDWQAGIVDSLNTAPARAAGQERLRVYSAFLQQAEREFNGQDLSPTGDSRSLSSHQPRGGDGGA